MAEDLDHCHRCGKYIRNTPCNGVHTCTPPAIVLELESQLAQAQAELLALEARNCEMAEQLVEAEAQVAALKATLHRLGTGSHTEAYDLRNDITAELAYTDWPAAAQRLLAAQRVAEAFAALQPHLVYPELWDDEADKLLAYHSEYLALQ